MSPFGRRAAVAARGFTLIELLFVLGVLAVLTSLAVPSFAEQMDRQRLQTAAEALAADLAEARYAAAQRGQPVHLSFGRGADWCYALASTPDCDCRTAPAACPAQPVHGKDLPGIRLVDSADAVFDPAGIAPARVVASFASARGERLQVVLSPLGRPRVCAPDGQLRRYPRC